MIFTFMELLAIAGGGGCLPLPPMVTHEDLVGATAGVEAYGLPPRCGACVGWGSIPYANMYGVSSRNCDECRGIGYVVSRATALEHVPGFGWGSRDVSADLDAARGQARAFDTGWFRALSRVCDAISPTSRYTMPTSPEYWDFRTMLEEEFHEIIACRVALEMTAPLRRVR